MKQQRVCFLDFGDECIALEPKIFEIKIGARSEPMFLSVATLAGSVTSGCFSPWITSLVLGGAIGKEALFRIVTPVTQLGKLALVLALSSQQYPIGEGSMRSS